MNESNSNVLVIRLKSNEPSHALLDELMTSRPQCKTMVYFDDKLIIEALDGYPDYVPGMSFY